jgi:predicted GNAT superfamily acetyltransferase
VDFIVMSKWDLRIIEKVEELEQVEALQRIVWPGSETDIVPVHLLVASVNNGGLVIGAYRNEGPKEQATLVGFVFGFPGLSTASDHPGLKHVSHMLAVHPNHRDEGLGFALKRAQWQMVRHRGIRLVSWTYDPLLSRNAYLNISKLGAVCNRYHREVYGQMRDGINSGLPSDRFEIDWWVNTKRVERRLSRRARRPLDLAHYFAAGAEIINPTTCGENGWAIPGEIDIPVSADMRFNSPLILLEIPFDFQKMRLTKIELAREWRMHTRSLFEGLFQKGYWVTDFVRLEGSQSRSFYVLSHGESTL